MRVAGLDGSEDLRYVGVVIGESGAIGEVYRGLRSRYVTLHCRELPSSLKRRLVEDVLAAGLTYVCVDARLVEAVREVQRLAAARGLRIASKRAWDSVKRRLAEYLVELLNRYRVDRVYADAEVADLLRLVGLRAPYGPAAELADPIAWANHAGLKHLALEERSAYEYLVEKTLRRLLEK